IKANHYLDMNEMNQLLNELRTCEDPFTCPHGRPVIIHFTTYEIEKMFKRIMQLTIKETIMKEKVIVIVGPTAVGKTELSLNLAKDLNGEIISGDSMQVYKELDIGTDKVTLKEREMVNHHLIDIMEMTEDFTVSDFQSKARNLIKEINGRGKIPIIVGGSGLYIQSVLYDYQFPAQARDEAITKDLENQIDTHGIEPLYNKLKEIDPEQAKKIHPNNHRRVVRALEIYKTSGLTMSEIQARQKFTSL